MKKDILIFLSDQHDGRQMSWMGSDFADTPHMDRLAAQGTSFSQAYTACPLCVPARMSLLTGKLPSKTGVFTNHGSIHPELPTFLHSLAVAGYETVLCGRMHFEGADQRHGFTKRIADDLTPTSFGTNEQFMKRFAPCTPLLTDVGCLKAIGGGTSLTLEYDRYIVARAMDYLAQAHDRPQCIIVGTYGPHYPYIAPPELYDKHKKRASLPENYAVSPASYTVDKLHNADPQLILAVRAAYAGMIEFEDACVGLIHDRWNTYLKENERQGLFLYISDHGDHAGERGLFGKQTLYEPAVRVPMIFSGEGIPAGKSVADPVSLLDLSPTICELAGAQLLPEQDGYSLCPYLNSYSDQEAIDFLKSRPIIAEWIDAPYRYGTHYGRMIRKGDYKLVAFPDFPQEDLLTKPADDIWEQHNLADRVPAVHADLYHQALDGIDASAIVEAKNKHCKELELITLFSSLTDTPAEEVWAGNENCDKLPAEYVGSEAPLPPIFEKIWNYRQS